MNKMQLTDEEARALGEAINPRIEYLRSAINDTLTLPVRARIALRDDRDRLLRVRAMIQQFNIMEFGTPFQDRIGVWHGPGTSADMCENCPLPWPHVKEQIK